MHSVDPSSFVRMTLMSSPHAGQLTFFEQAGVKARTEAEAIKQASNFMMQAD